VGPSEAEGQRRAARSPRASKGAWARRVLALPLALTFSCASTAPDDGDVHILLFTRTEGFRHDSIEPAVRALQRLAGSAGIAADATEDPAAFDATNLARYRAVVFLMTTGDVLDPPQESALMDFVRQGGGFVGVHSATDTEYGWPWYGQLVGAYFLRHPSNPGVREGVLRIAAAGHPATTGLPVRWVRADEWYEFRDVQPGLTALLEVDETSYKSAAESPTPAPRPIAWFRSFEGGRSFYTALGHTAESWDEPLFLSHVWGGIVSALGESAGR
jgi:type 1 glutamine amidotransferase